MVVCRYRSLDLHYNAQYIKAECIYRCMCVFVSICIYVHLCNLLAPQPANTRSTYQLRIPTTRRTKSTDTFFFCTDMKENWLKFSLIITLEHHTEFNIWLKSWNYLSSLCLNMYMCVCIHYVCVCPPWFSTDPLTHETQRIQEHYSNCNRRLWPQEQRAM